MRKLNNANKPSHFSEPRATKEGSYFAICQYEDDGRGTN